MPHLTSCAFVFHSLASAVALDAANPTQDKVGAPRAAVRSSITDGSASTIQSTISTAAASADFQVATSAVASSTKAVNGATSASTSEAASSSGASSTVNSSASLRTDPTLVTSSSHRHRRQRHRGSTTAKRDVWIRRPKKTLP